MQIFRRKDVFHKTNELSVVAKVLGNFSHNFLINRAIEGKVRVFTPDEFEATIALNESNMNFITNSSGLYSGMLKGNKILIMPLNTKEALVLFKKNENLSLNGYYWKVDTIEKATKLNINCYYSENTKPKQLIGNLKTLKSLRKTIIKLKIKNILKTVQNKLTTK